MSPDQNDDEPITPEVVDGGGDDSRGAAARKRRPGGPTGARPAGGAAPGARPARAATGSVFRMGCVALMLVGLFGIILALPGLTDPAGAQCSYARRALDEAADRDVEDWKHVPLPEGVEDADDIPCEEAVERAGNLPEDEEDSICGQEREAIEADGLPRGIDDADDIPCDETGELAAAIDGFEATPPSGTFDSEGFFRNSAILILAIALGQALAGFFLLRTRARRVRTIALSLTAIGVLILAGNIITLVLLVFTVYALAFSADARAIFPPNPGGGGFLRPRFPQPPPAAE